MWGRRFQITFFTELPIFGGIFLAYIIWLEFFLQLRNNIPCGSISCGFPYLFLNYLDYVGRLIFYVIVCIWICKLRLTVFYTSPLSNFVNSMLHGRPVLDTRMVLEAAFDYSWKDQMLLQTFEWLFTPIVAVHEGFPTIWKDNQSTESLS